MTDDAANGPPESGTLNLSVWPSRAAVAPTPALAPVTSTRPTVPGYEILGELGRGGMGVVYLARQTALNRQVALKMLLHGPYATLDLLTRFHAECQIVARLRDPGIVQVYDSGYHDGLPYCALEYLPGGSLADWLRRDLPPPKEAARLVQRLAQALWSAHLAGVVHRDLKPANVLFTADGQPRITDFGLALDAAYDTRLTGTGVAVGTPNYMAPEQARADKGAIGPAADIYALGAILYECLTGRPPFPGDNLLDVLQQVAAGDPPPPRRLGQPVPRDLEVICLKCLAKEPGHRYPSALALADDLGRFLEDRPIAARPAGEFEKLARWARRNPGVTGMAAAVVATFLIAFAVVLWSLVRAEGALAEARAREAGERWERYRANLIAAAAALQVHNVAVARQALDSAPAEHRGWEWRHYWGQRDGAGQVLGDGAPIGFGSQLTPDGRWALVNQGNSRFQIWDLARGQPGRTLTIEPGADQVKLSPDGRLVAYHAPNHSVTVLDVADGRPRFTLAGAGLPLTGLHFAADGTALLAVSSAARLARVWDLRTGELLQEVRGDLGQVLLVDEAHQWALAVGEGAAEARLWAWRTGAVVATCPVPPRPLTGGGMSPRGDRLYLAERELRAPLRLYELPSGRLVAELRGHQNEGLSHAFSADGTRLVTCAREATAFLWDAANGALVARLQGHTGHVYHAAFSPDGRWLVTASQDHTLRLWDAATGEALAVLQGHTADVFKVAVAADGSAIASAALDGTIRLWDPGLYARTGVLRGHTNFVYGVAWAPDGRRLASCGWDGTVRLWDVATGRQTGQLAYGAPAADNRHVASAVAFHPGGMLLATIGRDNAVRLWDVAAGAEVHRWPLPPNPMPWLELRLAFSPDGARLAAGAGDGTVLLWDVASRREVARLAGAAGPVRDVAFSPDGRWLAAAGSDVATVQLWDLATGQRAQALAGHTAAVHALAFSRDGRWLASGATDGTARLWDTAAWASAGPLPHGANVYGVAFTPDGTRLACASADGTVRLWDVARGQAVAELRGHTAYVYQLAFSPDGTRLATASGDFTVRVWDTLSAQVRAGHGAKAP